MEILKKPLLLSILSGLFLALNFYMLFFYNYFRYYDPEVGRYITSDPIGVSTNEINTYIYSDSNPVIYFDNLGLFCVYYQSTGIYSCYDTDSQDSDPYLTGKAYSGKFDPNIGFDARNDEWWEQVPNWGPIPKGCYKVKGKPGDPRRDLIPLPGTNTYGRHSFQIHGGYKSDDPKFGQASEGCVIINKQKRDQIKVGETFCVL